MRVIKCLTEKIEEELHDAEAYIDLAKDWKEESEDAADLFAKLSEEEMKHVDMLHEEVTAQIQDYREKHGDPPKVMLALYEDIHKKNIEKAMMIRVKQGMYKA